MTVPFWCVLVGCVLPYLLAGTSGYYKTKQLGSLDNHYPRAQSARLTGAGARVVAAQENAWEAIAVFAPAVVVNHLAGGDAGTASALALGWVGARLLHAVFYVSDLDKLRSLAFLVALVCAVGLFVTAA
ncbi:MAG: MAPEG family protein [Myxococcota bacterium]|nr:MAPEG family protein [Myxococcales bacterium]